jgi:coproporphyrinogen III oxidase
MRGQFEKAIRAAQDSIVAAVEELDGTPFRQDAWTRPGGGGGITRVLQGGNVWEKAGVNVSVVYGSMPAEAYRAAVGRDVGGLTAEDRVPFFAAGISSVMHPKNPHVRRDLYIVIILLYCFISNDCLRLFYFIH